MKVRRAITFLAAAAILATALPQAAEAATITRGKRTVASGKVFVPDRYRVNARSEKAAANQNLSQFVGTGSGTNGAGTFSYEALTEAYRNRAPFLKSRQDDNGRPLTVVSDCGSYYELDFVSLYAAVKYDAEAVESLAVGDMFPLDGKSYVLTAVREDGTRVFSRTGFATEEEMSLRHVAPKGKKAYYIADESAALYYTGKVRINKDAVIHAGDKTLTAEQYLTAAGNGQREGFRGGYNEREQWISLDGSFTLDAAGNIADFTER